MKRLIVSMFIALVAFTGAYAQKVGYVNSETILNSLPAYKSAQQKLESLALQYKDDLDSQLSRVEDLYNSYQESKNYLSNSQRQARETEIISAERRVKQKQEEYFGENGAISRKQAELLDPIRKDVEEAIDAFASANGYVMVIDITNAPGVMYLDPKADITQQIISIIK